MIPVSRRRTMDRQLKGLREYKAGKSSSARQSCFCHLMLFVLTVSLTLRRCIYVLLHFDTQLVTSYRYVQFTFSLALRPSVSDIELCALHGIHDSRQLTRNVHGDTNSHRRHECTATGGESVAPGSNHDGVIDLPRASRAFVVGL